jgi:CRP-like cAMP-binding protein
VEFSSLDALEGMTLDEAALLKARAAERRYAAGDVIVRMGERADSLFFLTGGSVSVRLPMENGALKELLSCRPGVVFGEMAFIDGSTRSAMVVADTKAVCYELGRADFEELGREHPALQIKLLRNLLRLFSANLRKANRELAILGQ